MAVTQMVQQVPREGQTARGILYAVISVAFALAPSSTTDQLTIHIEFSHLLLNANLAWSSRVRARDLPGKVLLKPSDIGWFRGREGLLLQHIDQRFACDTVLGLPVSRVLGHISPLDSAGNEDYTVKYNATRHEGPVRADIRTKHGFTTSTVPELWLRDGEVNGSVPPR